MTKPALHLDADTSSKTLYNALLRKGHNVTRTPNEWISGNSSEADQLLSATAHKRCIFTFNIRDFLILAKIYPYHGGIIFAVQSRWTVSELIASLDRLLGIVTNEELPGSVHWLNKWR